jgi:TolB-like protein/class 3 adenylate cyclase/Tfp pilus assembly protein PilF
MESQGVTRKLAAILSADVVGYSRLMRADEEGTLAALKAHRRELIDGTIARHHGRIVKTTGDGLLVEFASVVDAVRGAVEVQRGMAARNTEVPAERRIDFRIGVNLGDVIDEGDDLYGDGVNVAARLQALADPGGVLISGPTYDQMAGKVDVGFADLGEQQVKNIAEPVRVYRVLLEADAAGKLVGRAPARSQRWRWAAAAAVVLIAASGAATWWLKLWAPELEPASIERFAFPLPEKPSIAVLPFDNLSDDPKQEYFADAITEDVITELSRFSEFFVIARNSSFAYEGEPVPVRKVAEDLGVRYVLEGSVRKSSDGLRITAQLVDAMSGTHVWAERYDRGQDDLFAIQDEIVERIAGTLGGPGGRIELVERARAMRKSAPNLTAYDYYLRGREAFARFTEEGFAEARRMYRKAIELDRDFARPYASLAWVNILELKWGRTNDPEKTLERAYDFARKAATLDSDDYRSHWGLGVVYMWKRQHAQAIAEYERALALSPNNANLYAEMADALTYVGRADESIELAKKAIRLNPNYPDWYLWNLAAGYFLTKRYEDALATLNKMGNPADAHRLLAATYAQLGRGDEARAEAEKFLEINPDFSIARWAATQPYQDPDYFASYVEGLRRAGLPENPPLPLPDKPSIAVLPFENISGDPSQGYLGNAIAEDITTELSRFADLFVISRESAFTLKGQGKTARQIGRELGVRYILEGSVQRSGERMRVNAQLIEAQSGGHIWAERYDREVEELLAVQDDIVRSVVTTVGETIARHVGSALTRKPIKNFEAYDYNLRGQDLIHRQTKQANEEARNLLEKAVTLDPKLSMAYVGLAWTHLMDYVAQWSDAGPQALERAAEYTNKAAALEGNSYQVHRLLARIAQYQGDHEAALAHLKRALELNPNDGDLLATHALLLIYAGQSAEARSWAEEAIRRNPHYPGWYATVMAAVHYLAGRYREAVAVLSRIDRPAIYDHRVLAASYGQLGEAEKARAHVEAILKIAPNYSVAAFANSQPYRKKADLEHFLDGLRKAGLPE